MKLYTSDFPKNSFLFGFNEALKQKTGVAIMTICELELAMQKGVNYPKIITLGKRNRYATISETLQKNLYENIRKKDTTDKARYDVQCETTDSSKLTMY